MKDIKKYLIGFIVWLSLVWSVWYASNNYGSIWALFNIVNWQVLGMSWSSLMNWSVWTWKLDFKIATCLDANNKIVWTKLVWNGDNYDECTSSEWWTSVVY